MDEWAFDVFKGLHPTFLVFLVWGVAARMRSRRWSTFDKLLLKAFLLLEFLAAFQVWLFYGTFATSKRYLWLAIPLYLPFAALGVISLRDRLKKSLPGRIAAAVLLVLFALGELYNHSTPLVKQHRPCAKQRECAAARQAAATVKRDWKAAAAPPRYGQMKCDQYQSGKSPLVLSERRQVGYLCGGQAYPEFFRALGIPPDYVVIPEKTPPPAGFVRIGEVGEGSDRLVIYRRKGGAK